MGEVRMKLSERRCGDKHDAKPLWILICGELGCGVNILADEFEGSEHVAQLESDNEGMRERYYELILAVGTKCPDETRHETALRYIFEAEQGSTEAKEK